MQFADSGLFACRPAPALGLVQGRLGLLQPGAALQVGVAFSQHTYHITHLCNMCVGLRVLFVERGLFARWPDSQTG